MRGCAMEPRSAPPSPEEEADALYLARHRAVAAAAAVGARYLPPARRSPTFAHHQYSSYREYRPCRRHARATSPTHLDDDVDLTTLTTAEVHDYPSSESGIATDCHHARSHSSRRRPRTRSDDDDDDDDDDAAHSLDERCARDLDEILPARLAAVELAREPPVRWNRDNIAATMERFEPADYCYAYYEAGAGAAARHNLSMPSSSRKAGRQRGRGVGSGGQTAPRDRTARHAFVTRYGTEENIYEEIADGARSCPKHRYALRQSLVSLDQSVVEEEVRRVESRHKRILGELNLSVEAMLMPECESPDSERAEDRDNLEDLLRVGPTDELLSPASCNPPDLDSGFSGSSSGASYVGSLRYKTPAAGAGGGSSLHLPAVAYGTRGGGGGGVRILSAGADCGTGSARCARKQAAEAHSARSSSCGDNKSSGFWNKKAWRRIPGFSSSSSINKAGLAESDGCRGNKPHSRTSSIPCSSSYSNGKLVVPLDSLAQS